MVATLSVFNLEDVEKFKSKLTEIFCVENNKRKRYSEVWLSFDSFGGLAGIEGFALHVKAKHEIESCNKEMFYIGRELLKNLTNDEFNSILWIKVYTFDNNIHCEEYFGDIRILPSKC